MADVSELGVTNALSLGVKTRAKLSGALKGPLYWEYWVSIENAYIVR